MCVLLLTFSFFFFFCRRTGDVEVKEDNKTQLCSFCLAQCASVWGALLGPKGSLGCVYIQIWLDCCYWVLPWWSLPPPPSPYMAFYNCVG